MTYSPSSNLEPAPPPTGLLFFSVLSILSHSLLVPTSGFSIPSALESFLMLICLLWSWERNVDLVEMCLGIYPSCWPNAWHRVGVNGHILRKTTTTTTLLTFSCPVSSLLCSVICPWCWMSSSWPRSASEWLLPKGRNHGIIQSSRIRSPSPPALPIPCHFSLEIIGLDYLKAN